MLALQGWWADAHATTLREVVQKAVTTNPAIEAARANRRATEFELLQAEGRRKPRIGLSADIGGERIDRPNGFSADINDEWRLRRQGALTASQILFDGWERVNDIYRNAARVDSAAARVMARSHVIALDAVEAFVDVRRHRRVLGIANANVARHQQILRRVQDQVAVGKVPESEVIQVRERIAAAQEVVERIRQSLLEAEAKFLRVVGNKPGSLDPAGFPRMPLGSRQQLIEVALVNHPLLRAASADADAARAAERQARAGYYPEVGVEVRGAAGQDVNGTPGRNNEVSGRLVLSWQLYNGDITRNRTYEAAERFGQALAERDDRARAVIEEIDRSRAAYTVGLTRVVTLQRQAKAARDLVAAYEVEYTLAKRSLLDVLTAENASFQARIQVASVEAVNVVSAYRIVAAIGRILDDLGVAAPAEAGGERRIEILGDYGRHLPGLEPLR